MKPNRIVFLLSAILLLVCSLFSVFGCEQAPEEPEIPEKTTYRIKVTDYLGNVPTAYTVVRIYSGETRVAMSAVNDEGVAEFLLDSADYTFDIDSPGELLVYDTTKTALTPVRSSVDIIVYGKVGTDEKQSISVPDSALGSVDYDAALVGEGATEVTLDRKERSYFIFTPTRGGVYEFDVMGDGVEIGYYGGVHFVMTDNVGEIVEGRIKIEIQDSAINEGAGGTAQFVIGLTPTDENTESCILTVTRVSDAKKPVPYTYIYPDAGLLRYDSLLNHTLVDLDITDKNLKVVYNESDGYYHYGTSDGPVVLVKISASGNSHLPSLTLPSFVTICDTDRMVRIFTDEEGNVVLKEIYNDLILGYAELCGSRGVRPLDKKMADAIKNTGIQKGWWDKSGGAEYVFGADLNEVFFENAWLFACCYEEKNTSGTVAKPIVLTPSSDDTVKLLAELYSDGLSFVCSGSGVLTVENAKGITVTVGTTVYSADSDGVIKVELEKNGVATVKGDSGEIITFTYTSK